MSEHHEKRRNLVTATDVARLANGGDAVWRTVRREKKTGESSFHGNIYTEWGKEREPVMAAYANFAYDLEPNDKIFVHENGWAAATPDAIGPDENGEFKTSVKSLAAIPRNYMDQMQWAIYVRGVSKCVFVWEQHEQFVPLPIQMQTVERDEKRIAELIEIAERFREFLNEPEDAPGEFDDLLDELAEAEAAAEEAAAVVADVKHRITERIGDRERVSAANTVYTLSWFPVAGHSSFDTKKFDADHPGMRDKYMKRGGAAKPQLKIVRKK